MDPSGRPKLLPRGVWKAPFLLSGYVVLLVIDSHSDVCRWIQLRPGLDEAVETKALRSMLDRIDPALHLETGDGAFGSRGISDALDLLSRAEDEFLSRGVWTAPFLLSGYVVLLAVDSRSDVCRWIQLRPGLDEAVETKALESMLDRIDPALHLEIGDSEAAAGIVSPADLVEERRRRRLANRAVNS